MSAFWLKPEDHIRPEWFSPLEQLAELVACDPRLPQIDPDHFLYAARIERRDHPDLHVYRHLGTRKFLNVDADGNVWRYTGSDTVGTDRYEQFATIDAALDAVELFRGTLLMGHLRRAAPRPESVGGDVGVAAGAGVGVAMR